jgi:hypothetical protein
VAVTTATDDVTYLVLADRASPYLLARVRWPDVAQAITIGSPDWLDDPGLFDLPYDPSAVPVSFPQAASVAQAWGRQLQPEPDTSAPSFIRRMPANWSDVSPAERRALGIESVGKRPIPARALRRLRQLRASRPSIASAAATRGNGTGGEVAAGEHDVTDGPVNGDSNAPAEGHRDVRISVHGRALIRAEDKTISAGLVDLSESGMECVLPEVLPRLESGAKLSGPFLLELQGTTAQICLNVSGWISGHRSAGSVTYLGIAFGELSDAQTEGVRRFLASALSRGSR